MAAESVEVVDYAELLDMSQARHVLDEVDPHPSHLTNKKIAQALVKDLGR